jgi:Protein of unknown function (DUF4065)
MPYIYLMVAKYRFSASKALQAIDFMAEKAKPLDLHAALKACYFADRSHLNAYQQPIFGATYKAMKYGPVPLEIYEMIKGESLWLWELQRDAFPWRLDGHKIVRTSNLDPELDAFAESEREHLMLAFDRSTNMNFTERTSATHGADWQAANGGEISHEDMLEPREDRDAVIAFIRETARHIRL